MYPNFIISHWRGAEVSPEGKMEFRRRIDGLFARSPKGKRVFTLAYGLDDGQQLRDDKIAKITDARKDAVLVLKLSALKNIRSYAAAHIESKEVRILFDAILGKDPRGQLETQNVPETNGNEESLGTSDPQQIVADFYSWFRFYPRQWFLLKSIAEQYLDPIDPEAWAKKIENAGGYAYPLRDYLILKTRGAVLSAT